VKACPYGKFERIVMRKKKKKKMTRKDTNSLRRWLTRDYGLSEEAFELLTIIMEAEPTYEPRRKLKAMWEKKYGNARR